MGRKWKCQGVEILLPKGVEVRDFGDREPTVGIRFKYRGVACRELSLSAANARTAQSNVALASAKLTTVRDEITRGVFKYGEHFPDSKRCELFGEVSTKGVLVGELLDAYLAYAKTTVEGPTYEAYVHALKLRVRPTWDKRPVTMLLAPAIEKWVEEMADTGIVLKTARNYIVPFDCALSYAVRKGKLKSNPFRDISLSKIWPKQQRESDYKPDPFNADERAKILKVATPGEARMCLAWWYGGYRPEEFVALKWEDAVDLKGERVEIKRINRKGEIHERAKTKAGLRFVPMIGPALQAYKDQRNATRLKPHGFVWEYERTGRPYAWTHQLADNVWGPLLERAGVRHRGPSQNRHTFASIMFENSEPITTVSKILGHSDPAVTMKFYARMIERVTAKNVHGFALKGDYSKVAA